VKRLDSLLCLVVDSHFFGFTRPPNQLAELPTVDNSDSDCIRWFTNVYSKPIGLHVFLTDVCDCYVLVAEDFCLLFFFFFLVFIISHQCCYSNFSFSIHLLSFVPYTSNDLSHRRPALTVFTFPAAYHNRNVTFFSLIMYIALLWLINISSSSSTRVPCESPGM